MVGNYRRVQTKHGTAVDVDVDVPRRCHEGQGGRFGEGEGGEVLERRRVPRVTCKGESSWRARKRFGGERDGRFSLEQPTLKNRPKTTRRAL